VTVIDNPFDPEQGEDHDEVPHRLRHDEQMREIVHREF
jgi:hypothetical protein